MGAVSRSSLRSRRLPTTPTGHTDGTPALQPHFLDQVGQLLNRSSPGRSDQDRFYLLVRVVSGWRPDYVTPRRCDTPSSSNARRWIGVGVVMTLNSGRLCSVGSILFKQIVARSASRLVKLWTGWSSAV